MPKQYQFFLSLRFLSLFHHVRQWLTSNYMACSFQAVSAMDSPRTISTPISVYQPVIFNF